MTISADLKEVYASAPSSQRFIQTLAFSHSLFDRTYYLTNDNQDWTFLLETGLQVSFVSVPFVVKLPDSDGKGQQDLGITLANIGRDLIDPLEAAQALASEPIKCTFRVYLDVVGSQPQINPPLVLIITGVVATRENVSATANRTDVLSRSFPYTLYNFLNFPGLRR